MSVPDSKIEELAQFTAIIQPGKKRGRTLGFPTINQIIPVDKLIEKGVYASLVKIDSRIYKAATSVGSAETFGESEILAETYIFEFTGNLYGKELTIFLIKKIRNIQKFSSVEKLVNQIEVDIRHCNAVFDNYNI